MFNSSLFSQDTFYKAFISDLKNARNIVVIESPFITENRMVQLLPIFMSLQRRKVRIIVNTKPYEEHNPLLYKQALWAIDKMQTIGVEVLLTVGHHRKLAVIDNDILWEGSLNILSQNDSCELMRRIRSKVLVNEMLKFTGLKKWIK